MIARGPTRWLGVVALLGALAGGCARARHDGDARWIADAERRHALADQQLQAGNVAAAREALLGIVDGRTPADLPAGDRRGVLQDTYFRLAELDLKAGDPRAALTDVQRGLGLGGADDLFVANLLVVRGAAHEAMDDGAAAAADYHAALVINDKLLAETLQESRDARLAPGATP